MGEELEDMDPSWSPITPAKRDSSRIAQKKQCGELERESVGMPDNLKISKDDDDEESPNTKSRKRMRMKRHRPKVLDESRPTKSSTPKPHTPKPSTPRPARYVYSRKKSCKKNLEFSKPAQVYEATTKSKIVKRKRMMRKRMSVDKLIGLIRMIHEKISCRCESAILELTWGRRRLRTFTRTRRLDFSFFKCEDPGKSTKDSNELVAKEDFSYNEELDAKESIEAFFTRDVYKDALVDFATLRMKFLSIADKKIVDLDEETGSNQLVVWDEEKQKLKPKVDLDEETLSVWNNLMGKKKGEDSKTKASDEEAHKNTNMEEQRELFRGRVDSFIALMSILSGDRRFSRWKGSVVDSVVGVFLTQNVSDSLSSSAYMALAARYPPQVKNESDKDGMDGNMISENQRVEIGEPLSGKDEDSNHDYLVEVDVGSENTSLINKVMLVKVKEKQEGTRGEQYADSVDWEAVRKASVEELAKVIEERGMSNQLAERIKDFLDRLVKDHGAIDLEWLRDIPPDKAKDYLLSVKGLGLKSTECVRLLSLLQPAFPIDVNAGRVVVRLGWVKLRPLPDGLPFHLLNDYPELAQIQKYLWPRICDRDELTLYELHCYLNIFSKAFCTKSQPNCNACPMRRECKHYASVLASSRLHLEGSEEKDMSFESSVSYQEVMVNRSPQYLIYPTSDAFEYRDYQPVVDFPTSPETTSIVPLGGDIEDLGPLGGDIEDLGYEYEYDIPTIMLNNQEFFENEFIENEFLGNRRSIGNNDNEHVSENPPSFVGDDDDVAKAVVALSPHIASIPMPKQRDVQRLRTVHNVYELPDSHPLLAGFREREPEDPCPYLLAIWTNDETTNSSQESKSPRSPNECGVDACCSEQIVKFKKDETVEGTILIPCRTANKGRFPLNGTYFQINEVFADYNSSRQSIAVPRDLIWNLRRRLLYCGTSITSICKEMSLEEIVYCFQKGFICIRGFDTLTGRSHPLVQKFHLCKSRSSTKQ